MILSCDIGIRNLALCIMSAEDKQDLKTFNIHLWNVFDTLESDEHFCTCLQKNGKICNRKCLFKYTCDDNLIYSCKTHFPKNIKIGKTNHFKKKVINDYLLQDIADVVLTKLQCIYDTNPIFKELTSIVIELQPTVNQKMKFTSHIIYGKLVELMRNTKCTIRFVRAAQKLKAYTGPEIICKLKGDYAKRKWLSIQYSRWFLENKFSKEQKEKWLQNFLTCGKSDDRADCLLMAINCLHGIPKKQRTDKKGRCIK